MTITALGTAQGFLCPHSWGTAVLGCKKRKKYFYLFWNNLFLRHVPFCQVCFCSRHITPRRQVLALWKWPNKKALHREGFLPHVPC